MAYEYQGFASLSVNLNRQKYGALDISQVFNSQADLNYYISKGAVKDGVSDYWLAVTPYPYAGQYIALVDNDTREVSAYILVENEDGTFSTKGVVSDPVGDNKSIVVDEGVVKIVGFDGAEEGAQPRKKADGTIEWIKPDTTTVEGLQTLVSGLESDVKTLQSDKANKSDVYTKDEVNGLVSSVYKYKGTVATYSALPTADRAVGDVYNVEAADEANGIKAGDNVAWNGTGWDILSGTVDLTAYALKTDLDGKVDKNGTDRLITEAEGALLDTLKNLTGNEQVNVIDGVSGEFEISEDDKVLSVKEIAQDKIVGLADALANKVDAEDGKGLSTNDFTDELAQKLADIEDGAEVNVLEVIKLNGTALEITDKAVDIPVVTESGAGVVVSSDAENKVKASEDGTMEVNSLNVNKLTQTEGETLILNGGSSAN